MSMAPTDVARRTLLQNVAWTVPVIASSALAPVAAAASDAPVLGFRAATYNGAACGTITGASLLVTVAGIGAGGRSITLILTGHYAFADGTTQTTLVSDTNGVIDLPAIAVPAGGGTGAINATAPGATTASVALVAPTKKISAHNLATNGDVKHLSGVPATALPVGGWGWFLDGTDLYYYNHSTLVAYVIAEGVTAAAGGSDNNEDYVSYMQDGQAYVRTGSGSVRQLSGIPSTARPAGGWGWFVDGTDLYYFDPFTNAGYVAISGVTDPIGGTGNGSDYATYMLAGVAYGRTGAGVVQKMPGIPQTARPVGGWGWFLDGTDLYYFNAATSQTSVADTGVTSIVGGSANGADYVSYMKSGTAWIRNGTGGIHQITGVPSTARPVGGWGWFLDGTDLWTYTLPDYAGRIAVRGVISAVGGSGNNTDYVTYMQRTC